MSDFSQPPQQRDFFCPNCNGRIVIPFSLPSTTGPCPHCQGTITSPPPPELQAPPQQQAPQQYQQPPAQSPAAPASPPPSARPAAIPPRRDPPPGQTLPQPAAAPAAAVKKKRSSGIIPAMLGLLTLILAAGAAVYCISRQLGTTVDPPNFSGSAEDQEIKESNYIRIGWQKEAYDVFGGFMAAHTVETKQPFVYNSEKLGPR